MQEARSSLHSYAQTAVDRLQFTERNDKATWYASPQSPILPEKTCTPLGKYQIQIALLLTLDVILDYGIGLT
jgi:hypothetical protein